MLSKREMVICLLFIDFMFLFIEEDFDDDYEEKPRKRRSTKKAKASDYVEEDVEEEMDDEDSFQVSLAESSRL